VLVGKIGWDGDLPDVRSMRIPVRYLANLLTAGNEPECATRAVASRTTKRLRFWPYPPHSVVAAKPCDR